MTRGAEPKGPDARLFVVVRGVVGVVLALSYPFAMYFLLTRFGPRRAGLGRILLSLPIVVNLALLHGFAGSLLGSVPLVERFARLQHPDLRPEEIRYCRSVTVVWSVYFVINVVVCAVLAVFAPLSWWTLYTGVISYVAMGSLFTAEYLTRKYRFRRFGSGLHDRILERLLPVRPGAEPWDANDT